MRLLAFFSIFWVSLAANGQDSLAYKKRVLETTELDILSSFYAQDGSNAAVTGGIGTEELTDFATTIKVSIPLNDDDVLTIDGTISAYTSASSSNLDPFDRSGASGEYDDDDGPFVPQGPIIGSPWVASSGESRSDVWGNTNFSYSHSSDDRNKIWGANISVALEYDYFSVGFGGNMTRLYNQKNTELGVKASVFLDSWNPQYPTELDSYLEVNGNLNSGFFNQVDILDQNGSVINKNGTNVWSPFRDKLIDTRSRNSYTLSFSFSQILSRNAQMSLFADLVVQTGWLANPMQRVYFADRPNFYIGTASDIPNYQSLTNQEAFHLADDLERLPSSRLKIPMGVRLNYYLNERLVIRTYLRHYRDDWGLVSNTASIELPIKLSDNITLRPEYRYYQQSAIDYFAPYEQHLSTERFYTSDFDLARYHADQYGFGISYRDILTKLKIGSLGLKSFDLKYSNYQRSTGLSAWIVSMGMKFILE